MTRQAAVSLPKDKLMSESALLAGLPPANMVPAERGDDVDPWELLQKALSAAEEARRIIADQSARIEQLESLSLTDELTGLANRRGFEQALRRTLALASRHRGSGILAYIDLDDFKSINDRLGHAAGDAVLRQVGALLAANVRESDIVARLGGDEFVAVLVQANGAHGADRALALQRILNRSFARHNGITIPIRASMGAAIYGDKEDPETLMQRADKDMYANKHERLGAARLADAAAPANIRARRQGSRRLRR